MLAEDRLKSFPTESEIVNRARAGQAAAFDELFVLHKDGVYACLWHLLGGDAESVEEAVGAVFLNAYRSLQGFRGESAFSTWLYRIAVNEARLRIRQKRRWQLPGWLSLHGPDAAAETQQRTQNPEEQFVRAEQDGKLWQAVSALPEPYRTPVILRYMSDMPSPEIAEVLGRPAGTIRYQLSRAVQILRDRLGSEWAK